MLAVANPGQILLNQAIPNTRDGGNHPQLCDFLIPLSYDRAVVCLHGGGGTKESFAKNLLVTSSLTITPSTVRWSGLNARAAIAVFPQGQAALGAVSAWNPNGADTRSANNPDGVTTWSNGVMWSGADDPQFLIDLSTYIQATYPTVASKMVLAGQSNGGMMVNRSWYDLPDSYTHFCALSGPAGIDFLGRAAPSPVRPFFSQFGDLDEVIGINGGIAGPGVHFDDAEWMQQPDKLSRADVHYPTLTGWVGEMVQMQARITALTGGSLGTGVTTLANNIGTVTKWTKAAGKMVLHRLSAATHETTSQSRADGNVFNKWCFFADF